MSESRTGVRSPFGKMSWEQKVRLPELTGEAVERLAAEVGLSPTEWIRDVVMLRVHGKASLLSVYATRLEQTAGTGSE